VKNDYEVVGDTVVIYLTYKGKRLETVIDLADFEKVDSIEGIWGVCFSSSNNSFYVRGYIKNDNRWTAIRLHRLLCDAPIGMVVDHINHDTLDNRKSVNLRVVTNAHNKQNVRSYKNSTSQYRGVNWNKRAKKWQAKFHTNGKQVFLGSFDCELEAARVAREARLKHLPYTVEKEIIS